MILLVFCGLLVLAKACSASAGDGPISFKSSIVQHEKVVEGNKHVMLEWTI